MERQIDGQQTGADQRQPAGLHGALRHRTKDHEAVATDAAGKSVLEVMSNYQNIQSGDGYIRLYQFDEANSAIHVQTFSPYDTTTPYLTDPANQFDLPLNFDQRLGPAEEPDQSLEQVAMVPQMQLSMAINEPAMSAFGSFSTVPEPSTLVLVVLGAATFLGYYGCRRWL